jgi:hypothetical protein
MNKKITAVVAAVLVLGFAGFGTATANAEEISPEVAPVTVVEDTGDRYASVRSCTLARTGCGPVAC